VTAFSPAAVRSAILASTSAERPVTDEMIDAVRGPIPFDLLAARIWYQNQNLDNDVRLGAVGGLCMTPISEALEMLALDLRDPWTSYLHLCARLGVLLRYRLSNYAEIWEELFAASPSSSAKHLWTSCKPYEQGNFRTFADALALASEAGLDPLVTFGYDPGLPRAAAWACTCAEYAQGSPSCNSADVVEAGRFLRHGTVVPGILGGIREIVVFGLPRPADWPSLLVRDWGFWALLFAEESGADFEEVWHSLLSGGLPGLLAENDNGLVVLAGYTAMWHQTLLHRNLWSEARRRFPGQSVAFQYGATIVGGALGHPPGRTDLIPFGHAPTWSEVVPLTVARATGAGASALTQSWAGGVYTSPPPESLIGTDEARRLLSSPGGGPPPPPSRSGTSYVGPALAVAGVCLTLGALYLARSNP